MDTCSLDIIKIHILRIDPGEDLLDSINGFIQETGLTSGIILGGYGTLARFSLHWVVHNRIPTENEFGKGEGGIEILSMNGIIADSKPHIHVSLSTQAGGFGGHLEPGCIAYVLCELFIAETEGAAFRHEQAQVDIPGMGKGTIQKLVFD